MKRILCIAIACILASVLVSASDVSAVKFDKIIWNEYYLNGTGTTYINGNYAGSAVGEGMMVILDNEPYCAFAASTSITDLAYTLGTSIFQYYCTFKLRTCSQTGNQLKATSCIIKCFGQDGTTQILGHDGDCDATINLQGKKKLNGTVTFSYTLNEVNYVTGYTITGTRLGQYVSAPPIPE